MVRRSRGALRRGTPAAARRRSASRWAGAHSVGGGERRATSPAIGGRLRRGAHRQLLDRRLHAGLPGPRGAARPDAAGRRQPRARLRAERRAHRRRSRPRHSVSPVGALARPGERRMAGHRRPGLRLEPRNRADLGDRRQRLHGDQFGPSASASADVSWRPRALSGAPEIERRFSLHQQAGHRPRVGKMVGSVRAQAHRQRRAVRRRRRDLARRGSARAQLQRIESRSRRGAGARRRRRNLARRIRHVRRSHWKAVRRGRRRSNAGDRTARPGRRQSWRSGDGRAARRQRAAQGRCGRSERGEQCALARKAICLLCGRAGGLDPGGVRDLCRGPQTSPVRGAHHVSRALRRTDQPSQSPASWRTSRRALRAACKGTRLCAAHYRPRPI